MDNHVLENNKHCVKFKDGTGKQAIHYAGFFDIFYCNIAILLLIKYYPYSAKSAYSTETLYIIAEAMGKPLRVVSTNHY